MRGGFSFFRFTPKQKELLQPVQQLLILITNKTIDKKSSHNPYMQDYARFLYSF